MQHFRIALIGIALVCSLFGCGGNKEQALVGKWTIDMDAMKKDASNPLASSMAEGMAKSISIEFKADKSFTMSMIFPLEGKWSLAGDVVTLDVEKAMGQPVPADKKKESNMQFTMSGDGKTLTAIKKADDTSKGDLTFKKESS